MKKIFIDGSAGTTGLRIIERLKNRKDIEVMTLSDDKRKIPEYRKEALNSCDIAFLCLPDAAAVEAVSFIENPNVTVIDASTAHRTNPDWAYGFPELGEEFELKIKNSNRIANPGCYASGFISLVEPLVKNGIIDGNAQITCHAVSGYSGAGKKGIAQYEDMELDPLLTGPREYALTQNHKHIPEMKIISGLKNEPIFCPYVCNFYSGMTVTVPLFASQIKSGFSVKDIKEVYRSLYNGKIVKYFDSIDEDGFISASAIDDKDNMEITVAGNDERILLLSRFNNLGKGASGAAVECMNIKLGVEKETGLDL
ncbi:MAG: N-acetyl-gamma-glutamyl-phosphate reductase [Acutalibacteraceae bacterium]|nr:N-acetyl-gamma-glutamyl-phosphate reductase [Acutalibacteraceae bacterium]